MESKLDDGVTMEEKEQLHPAGEPASEDKATTDENLPLPESPSQSPSKQKSIFTDFDGDQVVLGVSDKRAFTGAIMEDAGCSCDLLEEVNEGVQVVSRSEQGTQVDISQNTDVVQIKKHSRKSKRSEGKDGDEGKGDDGEYDDDDYADEAGEGDEHNASKLLDFLQTVTPSMLSELSSNLESQAFSGYSIAETSTSHSVSHLYSLTIPRSAAVVDNNLNTSSDNGFGIGRSTSREIKTDDNSSPLSVTSVTWNSTGAMVMAAYGVPDKRGWCESAGFVACWNLSARDFKADKPSFLLEHSSYVTCVAAHPEMPAVFAAGSFNGEIMCYDVGLDEPLSACSKIDDYFHREPISHLEWTWNASEAAYQLCSTSLDGKVLIWSLTNKLKCPLRGFSLSTSMSPNAPIAGASSLSFQSSSKTPGDILVGSEGGGVVKLSSRDKAPSKPPKNTNAEMKWSTSALQALSRVDAHLRDEVIRKIEKKARSDKRRGVDLVAVYSGKVDKNLLFPSPVGFVYKPHTGACTGIQSHPLTSRVFATSGSDGTARIYHVLGRDPVVTLEVGEGGGGITGVSWSSTNPYVLMVGLERGTVAVFDLREDTELPVVQCKGKFDGKDVAGGITDVAVNGKVRNLVAGGDMDGIVQVWKVEGGGGGWGKEGGGEGVEEFFLQFGGGD